MIWVNKDDFGKERYSMNISMVIPTYWSREKADPWHEGDAVYDHPTPIDGGDDTLGRTLESIKTLKNQTSS